MTTVFEKYQIVFLEKLKNKMINSHKKKSFNCFRLSILKQPLKKKNFVKSPQPLEHLVKTYFLLNDCSRNLFSSGICCFVSDNFSKVESGSNLCNCWSKICA